MTPDTLELPELPNRYRWKITAATPGLAPMPLVELQLRRTWRWRTVGFSYVMHPNPRSEAHSPGRVGRALLSEHLARKRVGLV